MLTMGSLFDGIGGFPLAAVRNGITPVWASEIEAFPIEVTKHHFPGMIHVGDITKLDGAELPPVDIICGGSPCQDLSVAGARAGLSGARSGLFMEQIRIVKEMRNADVQRGRTGIAVRPRWMCWENVPGAFSSGSPKGEDFRVVLGILRRARERGKELPPQLKTALMAQAGLIPLAAPASEPIAFAANQRDEVHNLHNVPGALSSQPGMKQQAFVAQDCLNPWDTQQARVFTPGGKAPTLASADGGGGRNPAGLLFVAETAGSLTPWDNQQRRISTPLGVAPTINSGEQKPGGLVFTAGFCAGAAPTAGGIGYQVECAPTLKASESGTNMVPSVLCLNDQGGGIMACSEDVVGTESGCIHGKHCNIH